MEEICVKLVEGVYLGTYKTAMSKTTLKNNKITYILCVGNEMDNIFKNDYKFMKLDVSDSEDENILFNFDTVFSFIEEGRENGGVLIHCYGGISRSPTIAIAYLIKKMNITFEEAFNIVKSIKSDINPNEGFIEKLQIFDKTHNRMLEFVYKCSICRKTLFNDSNIDFEHEFSPKKNYSYKRFKKSFVNTDQCTSFFLNNLSFLNMDDEIGGKIMCPMKNCKNKIGEFNPKGAQCSCGSWVVPGIQIIKSKVDKFPYSGDPIRVNDLKQSMQPKI